MVRLHELAALAAVLAPCLLGQPSGPTGALQFDRGGGMFLADGAFLNVQAFGAVPNDGADDSLAFQQAIEALSEYKGGTVYVPVGEYHFLTGLRAQKEGIRIVCGGGLSFNEGEEGYYTGAALIAKSDSMILLDFHAARSVVHQGPQVVNCNFIDATPAGRSATLIRIRQMNRYVLQNVTVRDAARGIVIDAGDADASWGRLDQIVCARVTVCIEQAAEEGGFLMTGGDIEPARNGVGIRIRGAQVRVMGVKFDLSGRSTGIHHSGNAPKIIGNQFEQCGDASAPCIRIDNAGTHAWNGDRATIAGNDFRGLTGSSDEVAIYIASSRVDDTQILGNTYEVVQNPVVDHGTRTVRYEQGSTSAVKFAFSSLPTWESGTFVYCTDCKTGTSPCQAGGSGSFAFREGGRWNCK